MVAQVSGVLTEDNRVFEAIDTYEPSRHGDFTSHAEPLIEQAIRRRFGDIQPDLPLPQGDEPPANVPNQEAS